MLKKNSSFQKLNEDYMKNKIMNEEIIDQVKCVYGFDFIITFLKEKIFISCKYAQKKWTKKLWKLYYMLEWF